MALMSSPGCAITAIARRLLEIMLIPALIFLTDAEISVKTDITFTG
jgi:hypothetical protein